MYVFLRFFTFFFKIQKKHDFLRFFELLHTFSRTMMLVDWKNVEIDRNCTYDVWCTYSDASTFCRTDTRTTAEPFSSWFWVAQTFTQYI